MEKTKGKKFVTFKNFLLHDKTDKNVKLIQKSERNKNGSKTKVRHS